MDGDVLIWVGTKKARMLDVCFLVIGDDTCKEIHFGVRYTRPYNSEGASVSSIEYYPVSHLAKDVAIKKAESMKYMSDEDFEAGRPLKDHAYLAIDNTFLSIGNKDRLAILEKKSLSQENNPSPTK
ncbi:MAG: hypothetical protein IJ634_03425 [Bacteroidales bacterium]|nr:hypothetical protein [Bacteroidales bacterium]